MLRFSKLKLNLSSLDCNANFGTGVISPVKDYSFNNASLLTKY